MSGSSTNPEDDPPDPTGEKFPSGSPEEQIDPDALEAIRKESRAVLDHYIATMRAIDEKAMWLVRTGVIVIGLVVSAFGLTVSEIGNGDTSILVSNWAPSVFGGTGTILL